MSERTCDWCGEEIKDWATRPSPDFDWIVVEWKRKDDSTLRAGAWACVQVEAPMKPSAVCKYCIIDAVKRLDDRTNGVRP